MNKNGIVRFLLLVVAISLVIALPLHEWLVKKRAVPTIVSNQHTKKTSPSSDRGHPNKTAPNDGNDTDSTAWKEILGFYTTTNPADQKSFQSLKQFSGEMNSISTLTFSVTANGTLSGAMPTDGLHFSQEKHIKTYVAISNAPNGDFDPGVAHAVLNNPSVRQTAIQNMVNLVQNNGCQGVNIDFEKMRPTDRAAFTQFIQQLATPLHAMGAQVIVSLTAEESDEPKSPWSGAFDYHALGALADQIQLMTYDENGPWANPGPVAGLPWVEKTLSYAVSQIPASKILLGLPAYGYDWNTTTGQGNKAVLWKNVSKLLASTDAKPQWDSQAESPYFQYIAKDGSQHVVWYENQASIEAKTRLVDQFHLGGVSVWRTGFEDASFWQAVQAGLK